MTDNFPVVLDFDRLFLKLNRFICNYLRVLPDHWKNLVNYSYLAVVQDLWPSVQ